MTRTFRTILADKVLFLFFFLFFLLWIIPLDAFKKTTAVLMIGFLPASDWPAWFLLFQVLLPTLVLALDQPLSFFFLK